MHARHFAQHLLIACAHAREPDLFNRAAEARGLSHRSIPHPRVLRGSRHPRGCAGPGKRDNEETTGDAPVPPTLACENCCEVPLPTTRRRSAQTGPEALTPVINV